MDSVTGTRQTHYRLRSLLHCGNLAPADHCTLIPEKPLFALLRRRVDSCFTWRRLVAAPRPHRLSPRVDGCKRGTRRAVMLPMRDIVLARETCSRLHPNHCRHQQAAVDGLASRDLRPGVDTRGGRLPSNAWSLRM